MSRGRFITLEGGEGAGKSTQARLLTEWLNAQGIEALLTREPGGSPQGEELRALLVQGDEGRWDPLSETLLHFAARREHLRATIKPALARGVWVVCDRFADSTMAYQSYGLGVNSSFVATLYDHVVGKEGPDLTLVFDLEPEIGMARVAARGGDVTRYESMDSTFHCRVRDGFRQIAVAAHDRCVLIDASADVGKVAEQIRALVHERFGATT